jgi:hypothetical protein
MKVRVALGIWLLVGVGCSDDDDGTGGGSGEDDGADTMDVGTTDDGVDADTTMPTAESSGSEAADDGGAGEGIDEIVGEWVGKDPIAPMRADHMTVRADGTATAELYWIMEEGGLWAVQLQARVTAVDHEYAFSFTCDEVGDCTAYEFDTICAMLSLGFVCAAPQWYGRPVLVFERPE